MIVVGGYPLAIKHSYWKTAIYTSKASMNDGLSIANFDSQEVIAMVKD